MQINQKYLLIGLILFTIIVLFYASKNIETPIKDNKDIKKPNNDNKKEQFQQIDKYKFVNYNASWCGWSNKLRETWDKIYNKYNGNNNIEIVDYKCDIDDKTKEKCQLENVLGFPTIVAYRNNIEIDRYQGNRSFESIETWILMFLIN